VTSASWWVIMHDIQHILLILHTASSRTRKCMRHDIACFSQITMHPFKYISSARYSPIRVSMLIFLQCSERIYIEKTYTKCFPALSALINLHIFVPATVLVTGNTVYVNRARKGPVYAGTIPERLYCS
jgi:hypothetical protein